MAKGFKTGGKNFKPGQSGNPKGCPKIPEEIKEARKLNKLKVEELLNKFLTWPIDELIKFASNKESPVLELLIARILLEGIKRGDQTRLEFLFQRLVGKVKEEHDHNLKLNIHKQIVDFIDETESNKEVNDGQEIDEEEINKS